MNMNISVDDRAARAALARLSEQELPSAARNLANDMAFDLRQRLVTEIGRVFDRPTPATLKLPRVKRKATKERPEAELWVAYFDSSDAGGVSRALTPHVPGSPPHRGRKGMERRLERRGWIGPDEWLMPSTALRLDRFGNVPASVATKMLADIGAYAGEAGFEGTTKPYARTTRGGRRRATTLTYYWLEVATRGRAGTVKGIWRKEGNDLIPQMVVVKRAPVYAKRFRVLELSRIYMAQRFNYHAGRVVAQAIGRRT